MLPLHFSHLYKFSYVPKSDVRAISLLPSSLHYATSYKVKHCLLGRKYANDTAAPFDLSFHTPHRDAQSLYVQGLVLSFSFCICGYSNNSCTLGCVSCFKLFYLFDHCGIYRFFKQCSCNTINHTSSTSLGCFSYITFRDTTVYRWFLEAKCMFSCVFSLN